jgi:antitoxin (DNA-binding transcriptional repressor) of toxin-antitoxin stability system
VDVVNVQVTKTYLSRLLDRVAQGEETLLARNGIPVARLVPARPVTRRPGALRGRITMSPEFDDPLPADIARAFGSAP